MPFVSVIFAIVLAVTSLFAATAPRFPLRPAASVLFTPLDERGASFTADGRTIYFCSRVADGYLQVLCTSSLENGRWTEPKVLPFSGRFYEGDPFVTADGRSLYFASNRTEADTAQGDLDLWVADKDGTGWSPPRRVSANVNTRAQEYSPMIAPNGDLWFASSRSGGGDLYVARRTSDGFAEPESLGAAVNGPHSEAQPALSPDGRTLVFASIDRPEEVLAAGVPYSRGDLYSSRFVNGAWTPARRLPAPVNSPAVERSPSFSADGRTLYFTSERGFATDPKVRLTTDVLRRGLASALNGRGNVYAVDARVLESP